MSLIRKGRDHGERRANRRDDKGLSWTLCKKGGIGVPERARKIYLRKGVSVSVSK